MPGGWVYILTNRPKGTLYIGVPEDLARRLEQHRSGFGSKFVQKYDLKHLVYVEGREDIQTAIQRETSLKRWPRTWKVELIEKVNPEWNDLAELGP